MILKPGEPRGDPSDEPYSHEILQLGKRNSRSLLPQPPSLLARPFRGNTRNHCQLPTAGPSSQIDLAQGEYACKTQAGSPGNTYGILHSSGESRRTIPLYRRNSAERTSSPGARNWCTATKWRVERSVHNANFSHCKLGMRERS